MKPGPITEWVKRITKLLNVFNEFFIPTVTTLFVLGMLLGFKLPKGGASLAAICYATIIVLKLRRK